MSRQADDISFNPLASTGQPIAVKRMPAGTAPNQALEQAFWRLPHPGRRVVIEPEEIDRLAMIFRSPATHGRLEFGGDRLRIRTLEQRIEESAVPEAIEALDRAVIVPRCPTTAAPARY